MQADSTQESLKSHFTKMDEESERFFEKQMEDAKKSSAADRDFFSAAQVARYSVKQDGLLPTRNEDGEAEYTAQQGFMAACQAREDVIAIANIQRSLLLRLDRNRNLLWGVICLLTYIAYRLS